MAKPRTATKEEIAHLYDPNTFYDYQSNPALKNLMAYMVENAQEGKIMDTRTFVRHRYVRAFWARNFDDFLNRDLQAFTFTRAFFVWIAATMGMSTAGRWSRQLLPVGDHGITKVSQTQLYHLDIFNTKIQIIYYESYGPVAVAGVLAFYGSCFYLWYKTTKFTAKKFYTNVLLGERNWLYERERQNISTGEYFFDDTPLSHNKGLSDLARYEMAKGTRPTPEWHK